MHVAHIVDYTGGLHMKGVPFFSFCLELFGYIEQKLKSFGKIDHDSSGQSRNGWRGHVLHHLRTSLPSRLTTCIMHGQVFITTHYKDLRTLSEKQMIEMWNWRAMYGQSVPEKTVRNITTKYNLELFLSICIEPNHRLYNLKISLCAVK